MRRVFTFVLVFCVIIAAAGCGGSGASSEPLKQNSAQSGNSELSGNSALSGSTAPPGGSTSSGDHAAGEPSSAAEPASAAGSQHADDGAGWIIRVVTTAGEELWRFTESGLNALLQGQLNFSAYVYSTINNWPSSRFYVAEGYGVASILRAAGVYETAQTVIFRAGDGYEVSLTRDQLFSGQYYFPQVGESDAGAEQVQPIIAYRWREGSADIGEVREDKPIFIFGQQTPYEHTNPAFVVGVTEIVIDTDACETWQAADTFPQPGAIEPGAAVKLQHPYFGLVKMYYTLDGSEPTARSLLYNPSTYQTELNKPIPIAGPVVIKVLVTGYGRNDSEIAVFEFWPEA